MSKITYESLRKGVDEILEMAKPILEQKNLIDELHKRICFWDQDYNHWFTNNPELEYCMNHDCQESCTKEDCPEDRKKASSLRWGLNSLNEITKLIGEYDMYCYGRKEYKCGE